MSDRRGDWLQTFSGTQFWPLDPRPSEIAIVDIAHALAHQCRYGGHTRRFYSVAEHCVLMARHVPAQFALAALLHDATQAYLVDVLRPIKGSLTNYGDIEWGLERAIAARFGVPTPLPDAVKEADLRILSDEMRQAMAPPPAPWSTAAEPLGVTLFFWPPKTAKGFFLKAFDDLWARHGRAAA